MCYKPDHMQCVCLVQLGACNVRADRGAFGALYPIMKMERLSALIILDLSKVCGTLRLHPTPGSLVVVCNLAGRLQHAGWC